MSGKPTVPTVHHQDAEPLIPNLVRATGVSRGDLASAVTVDLVSDGTLRELRGPRSNVKIVLACAVFQAQFSSVDPSLQETLAQRRLQTRMRKALYLKRVWQVSIVVGLELFFQSTHAASYKYLPSKLTRWLDLMDCKCGITPTAITYSLVCRTTTFRSTMLHTCLKPNNATSRKNGHPTMDRTRTG